MNTFPLPLLNCIYSFYRIYSSHFLVWYLPGSQNAPGQKQCPLVVPVKPNLNWKPAQTNKVQATSASCEKCYSRSGQINPWTVNMKLLSEEASAVHNLLEVTDFVRNLLSTKKRLTFYLADKQNHCTSCCHLIAARQTKRLRSISSAGGVYWGLVLSKQFSQQKRGADERALSNAPTRCPSLRNTDN